MQITRGKMPSALKVVIYGPEGIGKSTFASQFPEPLFIDTEGSTKFMDVARLPAPKSWVQLLQEVEYVKQTPGVCRSLIIDTADWAEQLAKEKVLGGYQKKGIEDFGYGKGYIYLSESFGKLLNLLEDVISRGIHVVLTAHAKMRKFEQPDENGAYDRWELKLEKTVAPLVKEWADLLLFANYKTVVINVDGQGAQKGKNKAQGGKRVMYTTHNPCWDAKNRHGLADELPFDYREIAGVIGEAMTEVSNTGTEKTVTMSDKVHEATENGILRSPLGGIAATGLSCASRGERHTLPQNDGMGETPNDSVIKEEQNMPRFAVESHSDDSETQKALDALSELMENRKITDEEVRQAVHKRGYYPTDMEIARYPLDFIKGVLIGAFEQIAEFIEADPERLPF